MGARAAAQVEHAALLGPVDLVEDPAEEVRPGILVLVDRPAVVELAGIGVGQVAQPVEVGVGRTVAPCVGHQPPRWTTSSSGRRPAPAEPPGRSSAAGWPRAMVPIGSPAVGHAERGQQRGLVVEEAEEAGAEPGVDRAEQQRARRHGRVDPPVRHRPGVAPSAQAGRPPCRARRSARRRPRACASGDDQHRGRRAGPGQRNAVAALGRQGDVPVAGGLLGALEHDEGRRPGCCPADGRAAGQVEQVGRATLGGDGRSVEGPHHAPAADGVARAPRAAAAQRELGEVLGHGPAEGDERVAPLGVDVVEEGATTSASMRLGLQALVVEHQRGGCRRPWR